MLSQGQVKNELVNEAKELLICLQHLFTWGEGAVGRHDIIFPS